MEENKEQLETISARLKALEEKSVKDDATIKMLEEVADKGRVFNYQSQRAEKKPIKVKLSVYDEKIITGWRTIKDTLIKHPQTGRTTGEEQQYEILLLDKKGETSKKVIDGYLAFSDARYTERIEAEVVSKKEDYSGNLSYELKLPDGRNLSLDARFIN